VRNKITIGLSLLALVIGAAFLYGGGGRASWALVCTASALIFAQRGWGWGRALTRGIGVPTRAQDPEPTPSNLVTAFYYLAALLCVSGFVLMFTGR